MNEDSSEGDDFLSVVYSALAVGCLFLGMVEGNLGIEDPRLRAFQYYQASKRLFEPLDRANSEILQSLLCQVLFLQSTANMSTCWTYLGPAIRCAQRMGRYRKLDNSFNPIETQLRKKQFWAIRNVELYLHAVLGLPVGMTGDNFDQTFPAEIDDEYISEKSMGAQPSEVDSSLTSVNAYSRLMTLMQEINRVIYPLETPHNGARGLPVSHATLEKLQGKLDAWVKELPSSLKPDFKYDESTKTVWRQSRLLRFTHAYILLYRPYLHYLRVNDAETNEFRIYAARAKDGAMGVLILTEEIFATMPECFGHWFSIYDAFFAGTKLSYSALQERPVNADRGEVMRYIGVAKQAMEFCQCSYAAERCLRILEEITHNFPSASNGSVPIKQARVNKQHPLDTNLKIASSTKRPKSRRVNSALKPPVVPRMARPNLKLKFPQPMQSNYQRNNSMDRRSETSLDSDNSGSNNSDKTLVNFAG